MPIEIRKSSGGPVIPNPFVGPVEYRATVRVDVSGLTDKEVNEQGYLKPGVLLKKDGTLIAGDGGDPEGPDGRAYGAVVEATKVAESNTAAALAAASDIDVAVCTIGQINQKILEDLLDRALTTFEIAGVEGTPLVLV